MMKVLFFSPAISGLGEIRNLGDFVAAWGKGRSEGNGQINAHAKQTFA